MAKVKKAYDMGFINQAVVSGGKTAAEAHTLLKKATAFRTKRASQANEFRKFLTAK